MSGEFRRYGILSLQVSYHETPICEDWHDEMLQCSFDKQRMAPKMTWYMDVNFSFCLTFQARVRVPHNATKGFVKTFSMTVVVQHILRKREILSWG